MSECEFDCDPSGPNNDLHAPRCPIYLEAEITRLRQELEAYKLSGLSDNHAREAAEAEIRAEKAEAALAESLARERVKDDQLKTMNARIALDAKSYERDQYLICKLREQLAALSQTAKAEEVRG